MLKDITYLKLLDLEYKMLLAKFNQHYHKVSYLLISKINILVKG